MLPTYNSSRMCITSPPHSKCPQPEHSLRLRTFCFLFFCMHHFVLPAPFISPPQALSASADCSRCKVRWDSCVSSARGAAPCSERSDAKQPGLSIVRAVCLAERTYRACPCMCALCSKGILLIVLFSTKGHLPHGWQPFIMQTFAEFTECRTTHCCAVGDDTFRLFTLFSLTSKCFFFNCYTQKSSATISVETITAPCVKGVPEMVK